MRRTGPSGWEIALDCVICLAQLVAVVACFVVMLAALKSNGMWYTATVESTRFNVWIGGSGVALLTVISCLAGLYGRYRVAGHGLSLVWLETVATAVVLAVVIWFHGAVPVPPGTHSGPMFTGY
jgi:hypothetical protein